MDENGLRLGVRGKEGAKKVNRMDALWIFWELINSYAMLMPEAWKKKHLERTREAWQLLYEEEKQRRIMAAKRHFNSEIRLCGIGIEQGTADREELERRRDAAILALEGLEKL